MQSQLSDHRWLGVRQIRELTVEETELPSIVREDPRQKRAFDRSSEGSPEDPLE